MAGCTDSGMKMALSPGQERGSPGKLVIGLTGGIGSGKSTVAGMLAEHGVAVIDSDRLNAEQLAQPDVVETLVSWFGENVRDPGGGIRRKAIARIVFDDADRRARLEGLLHPRIAARRSELLAKYRADPAVRAVAIDSPLLYEVGLDRLCDVVLFVDAPQSQRLQRVASARGWSADELARRENSQEAVDSKRAKADHIVTNNSGLDELRSKVEAILSDLLARVSDA